MQDCPAAVHFVRLTAALAALAETAAGPDGGRLAEVLAGDEVALVRMRAAAAVVRAAGLPVDLDGAGGLGHADLLDRVAGWRRYAAGPVSPLHGACGRDIARGLLRLWALARPVPVRQPRLALLGRVRSRCAALRAELRADAAALTRSGAASFAGHVVRRVGEVRREVADETDWELGGPDPGARPVPLDLPAPGAAGLENRLTGLLGAGFGIGVAMTLGRVLGEVVPGPTALVVLVCAVTGVTLGGWLVATRRLLCRRAVADRWVVEVTAALRAALEDHVATRMADYRPDRPGR